MKSTDRTIVFIVPIFALILGFWLLILSPKRDEAKQLGDDVASLQTAISAAEQQVVAGEAARDSFPENYERLVAYGKAAPEDGDQASLIYAMAEIGRRNEIDFRGFTLQQPTEAPPPPTTPAETSEARVEAVDGETATASTTTAPATETAAALLPLGASVGAAGLPVAPYTFNLQGSFFDMAGFFAALDRQVRTVSGEPEIRGRLITIDGFSLSSEEEAVFPELDAEIATTTYIVPAEQGVSAGATPAGPAPTGTATTVPETAPVTP